MKSVDQACSARSIDCGSFSGLLQRSFDVPIAFLIILERMFPQDLFQSVLVGAAVTQAFDTDIGKESHHPIATLRRRASPTAAFPLSADRPWTISIPARYRVCNQRDRASADDRKRCSSRFRGRQRRRGMISSLSGVPSPPVR